jgi:DNA-binding NarL/FixJ family response regulator
MDAAEVTIRIFGQPHYVEDPLLLQATVLKSVRQREQFATAIGEARLILEAHPDEEFLSRRRAELEEVRATTEPPNGERSVRELTVLRLMRGTLSERDIGRELYISPTTQFTVMFGRSRPSSA